LCEFLIENSKYSSKNKKIFLISFGDAKEK